MQRGIPAMVDKWTRTEMALKNGVDLVLELPLVYSVSSAEHFAFGSVSLLNSLGIIDNLYFLKSCRFQMVEFQKFYQEILFLSVYVLM